MKFRQDYVSNSSSCSFIIHIRGEGDKVQLAKNEKLLKEYARGVSGRFIDIPYGDCSQFESVNNLRSGEFVRIYIGEDNEFNWEIENPYSKLCDIACKLNDGSEVDLQFYADSDAHVTLGDPFDENRII